MLATSHSEFIQALLSKEVISVLQEANAHRNTYTGHGGILTDHLAGNLLPDLQASLAKVRSCYGTHWNRYLLILPTTGNALEWRTFQRGYANSEGFENSFPDGCLFVSRSAKNGSTIFL